MAVNPIAANTQANGYFLNREKVARVPLFRNGAFSAPVRERQIKDLNRPLPGPRNSCRQGPAKASPLRRLQNNFSNRPAKTASKSWTSCRSLPKRFEKFAERARLSISCRRQSGWSLPTLFNRDWKHFRAIHQVMYLAGL